MSVTPSPRSGFADVAVHELRQYRTRSGGRERLHAMFLDHLIGQQEACGIRVGGTFGDEDHPDRFIWFRGFADHGARAESLRSFYLGPDWAAHRDEANATMLDSDDVLVLRPMIAPDLAPSCIAGGSRTECLALAVLKAAGDDMWPRIERLIKNVSERFEAPVVAWLRDPTPNGFPALPVRDDDVGVVAVRHADPISRDAMHIAWPNLAERVGLDLVQTARLNPLSKFGEMAHV